MMQAINVHSVIRKQPKKYRKSTPERTAENVLKRDFNASSPNEKWVTDVTEFKETASITALYFIYFSGLP